MGDVTPTIGRHVRRVLSVFFPRPCENASSPSREYNRAYVDVVVLVVLHLGLVFRSRIDDDDCDGDEDGLESNKTVAIQRRL